MHHPGFIQMQSVNAFINIPQAIYVHIIVMIIVCLLQCSLSFQAKYMYINVRCVYIIDKAVQAQYLTNENNS